MSKTNLAFLRQKVNELSAPKSSFSKDSDGYYQTTVDGTGSGSAIIRFLPAQPGDEFPFVQIYNHAFQGPSKWFIEGCPSTIGLACPVCEANKTLLLDGSEVKKKLAGDRKRKMNYVSNVLIVKDPKASEKEGKVFLYKYGVKVMDKIKDMIAPPFADSEPTDPFDPETGANFRLRVVKTGNFPDYDKSAFDKPSPLGDPQAVETVVQQCRSLAEIVAPKHFKSYTDLMAKFRLVCGTEVEGLSAA
jgi:gp32 DNA binding protein like